jgi:BirA family biotin operon repressor/biotin-[acetyl-CoA-carboxylase] ligase
VCLAIADRQTAGRGRDGRSWLAPTGAALLVSLGFRPTYLAPDRAWQLAGTVSVAMAEAAEREAGLVPGAIRLKWPNDLAIEMDDGTGTRGPGLRKLAGVLGESQGLGTHDPRVVVGIGVNADWPAATFPPELAAGMTSLREASGGRRVAATALLDRFLAGLEPRLLLLRDGRFDAAAWASRQATTGREVLLELPGGDGQARRALGVDSTSGALVVEDGHVPSGERLVHSGEIRHVRVVEPASPAQSGGTRIEV